MNDNVYVNSQAFGKANQIIDAIIDVQRQIPVVENTEDWKVAVERFYFHGALLPLFDPQAGTCTVTIETIVGGAMTTQDLDFSPYQETDGFIYDYKDVAKAMNDAFDALATTLTISGPNTPVMSFNPTTKVFSITTNSTFRSAYKILFNEHLFFYMPSFDYVNFLSSPHFLDITGDTFTQHTQTIEMLSPVSRIVITTSSLPVRSELLPPPKDANTSIAGVGAESEFLVDFKYTQQNNVCMNHIEFVASDSDHRWHDMKEVQGLTKYKMAFNWYDYNNVGYPMKLYEKSSCDVKLYFAKE